MSTLSRLSTPRAVQVAGLGLWLLLAAAGAGRAQPFGAWLTLSGPTHGYVQIPTSADLNPGSALTVEAWVAISDSNGGGCSSIVGKNWTKAWWIGICGTQLRSYIRGFMSADASRALYQIGTVPTARWTHVAVVFDGANRRHYINGELVGTRAEPVAILTATSDAVRIGSDVQWPFSPAGAIDEVRVWSVARSQQQLRDSINVAVPLAPATGLVAEWHLDANALDAADGHNGALGGSGVGFLNFPATFLPCSTTAGALCLHDRYVITARYRTGAPGTPEGTATTVPFANEGSGLFWFFSPDNWEVMVKVIDACSLNSRYWVFSAATTNVFYRLEVLDRHGGGNKVYFNYPGPPAPAVTDTAALATCP